MYDYVFLALAKNCSKYLKNYFYFIKKLSKSYNVLVIVGENSSNDGTLEFLISQKKSTNLVILNTSELSKYSNRIYRLSLGRQILKNYIEKKKIKSRFIVINDLDDVLKKKISIKNFLRISKILEKNKKDLFGISVKSSPYYYDLLVLKIKDLFEFNVLKIQRSFAPQSIIQRLNVLSKFKKKITYMKDLKSISSFNGMCIYLSKDYKLGSYLKSKTKKNVDLVDHLSINQEIHNKSKKYILISNILKLRTPKDHSPRNIFTLFFLKVKNIFS